MKKKIALMMLLSAVAGFALTGCAEEDTTATETAATSEVSTGAVDTSTLNTEGSLSELICAEYVTLGEYKGVEVSVPASVVTDAEIDDNINSYLTYSMAEEELIEEGVVAEGDTVRIDYVGSKDGVAFDGGTAEGYDLTIGSGTFIPGFEDGLIGVAVGDTVTLDLTFPEEYGNADLAGQLTQFEVTVHAIVNTIVPDLTEENVADVASVMGLEADSIETLRQLVSEQIMEQKEASREEEISYQVQDAVFNNLTINKTAEFLQNRFYIRMDGNYNYYAYMYNSYGYTNVTDGPSFLEMAYGIPQDQYTEYVMGLAKDYADQFVGFQQIAEIEGLTVSDEEAMEEVNNTYAEYGYDSAESFLAATSLDEFRDDIMFEKVLNFIIENAVVVDAE